MVACLLPFGLVWNNTDTIWQLEYMLTRCHTATTCCVYDSPACLNSKAVLTSAKQEMLLRLAQGQLPYCMGALLCTMPWHDASEHTCLPPMLLIT